MYELFGVEFVRLTNIYRTCTKPMNWIEKELLEQQQNPQKKQKLANEDSRGKGIFGFDFFPFDKGVETYC